VAWKGAWRGRGCSFTGYFESKVRFRFFRRPLYWGPQKIRKRLRRRAFLFTDPTGEPAGGTIYWGQIEGSGNGASLSMGALRGEPGEMAHLLGILKNMWSWFGKQTALYIGVPLGNLDGGLFTTEFDRRWKKALKRRVYLWDLCGEPGGRIPLLGTLKAAKTCQRRLWKWSTSLLIKDPRGEPGGRDPIRRTPQDL
jgi:hypothetical protein